MNVCAGGLSSPSGRCHPLRGPQTTREAGQNSQAVFTQEARAGGSLPWPWASWLPSTGPRRGWVECRALRLPVSPCSALCSQCATCHKCLKLGAKCSARGPGAGPGSCLPASAQGTAAWRIWGASCFSPGSKELGGQRDRRVQRNSSYNTDTLRHRHAQTHTHTHTLPA